MTSPRESIAVLREGQEAPEGKEIVRVLSERYELTGPGANYQIVYTVAVRDLVEFEIKERAANV